MTQYSPNFYRDLLLLGHPKHSPPMWAIAAHRQTTGTTTKTFRDTKGVLTMPIISMFYGIKIYIYVERDGKHSVPHVHAYYGEDSLVVYFDGNVIEEQLPRKKQAMVIAWVMMHDEELRANYELMLDGQLPFRIDPLK